MAESDTSGSRLDILCPCCGASIVIDRATGVVIHFAEKKDPRRAESIGEMLQSLDAQKSASERLFEREMSSMKDRGRLLDEKLKDAVKRSKESKDVKPIRDIDID